MDKLNLPNRSKTDISYTGEALIFQEESVKDVLFMPNLKLNLLSVPKVTRQLSGFVSFYLTFVCFKISTLAG